MLKRFYETYNGADEKLSPVVREIAPQAEQIFRDQYVMEFIGGKEYKHENNMKAALIRSSSSKSCITLLSKTRERNDKYSQLRT